MRATRRHADARVRVAAGVAPRRSPSPAARAATTATAGTDGGGDGDLTPVKLQLQWLPQAQFAGYYVAVDQGYFEDEGFDVEIIPAGGPTSCRRTRSSRATSTTRSRGCPRCSASIEHGRRA